MSSEPDLEARRLFSTESLPATGHARIRRLEVVRSPVPKALVHSFPEGGPAMVAIARALSVAVALLALLGSGRPLLAQESDVEAIKRVVRGESDAYFRRDSTGWKSYHVQDSNAVVVGMGS